MAAEKKVARMYPLCPMSFAYLAQLEDADMLWTCASFGDGTDYSEFLQEVEASDITCASGKAPMFTGNFVGNHKSINVCDNTVISETKFGAAQTSNELDETLLALISFLFVDEIHAGCSNDGGLDGSTTTTTTTPNDSTTTSGGASNAFNSGDGGPSSGGAGNTASSGYARTSKMAGLLHYWMIFLFIASVHCFVLL
jgi:hypothetical protein